MNKIRLYKAQTEEFQLIARFIAEQNRTPERHCLHSDRDEGEQGIYQELMHLNDSNEICFIIARQEDRVRGKKSPLFRSIE